jgi:hypothetical protein
MCQQRWEEWCIPTLRTVQQKMFPIASQRLNTKTPHDKTHSLRKLVTAAELLLGHTASPTEDKMNNSSYYQQTKT